MIAPLVLRGLAAGLVAGLVAGLFALALGEPALEDALAVEERARALAGEAAPAALVGRATQRAGLVLASGLYGACAGGLFGLAFAAVRGRAGRWSEARTALALAGVLWASAIALPALKYPAAPPGVGDPGTIGARMALYLTMVVVGLLAALAGWRVARSLPGRWSAGARGLVGVGTFALTVGLAWAVIPGPEPAPAAFPADLLWRFSLSSLAIQLVLWAVLGVAFAVLTRRAAVRRTAARRAPA
jgi:hypothetical protein